jgi:hypothetical protein
MGGGLRTTRKMAEYEHPAFPQPSDPSASVWRYMPFDRFRSLITQRRLYMSRLSNFDDTFEGTTPHGDVATWEEALASASSEEHRGVISENRERISAFRKQWAGRLYVNCWHLREHESIAMWERYSETPEAVVIRTSYANLKKCKPERADIGLVRYVDWATARLPSLNMYQGVMHKRKEYEDEREVRLVVTGFLLRPDAEGTRPEGLTEDARGYLAPVDTVALIEEVRVHPKSAPEFLARVRTLCRSRGLPEPLRSSLIGEPRF